MSGRGITEMVAGVALVLALVGCGGSDATPTPTTTAVVPTPTATVAQPTPTVSVEEEVIAAYLAYWERYAEAMLTLDPTVVADVASDEELRRVQGDVEMLRAQGVAARVVLEHNPVVIEASATAAIILDEMTNNSFYVDPETLQPEEGEGSGETLRDTFFLEKVDGRWIVVRSVRQD
ncbi:MAG: hypothetical protein IH609_17110 [Dehalococcoidia bacterium]|nr:hypothetical protein [Dehalococcoidia bacterium]